MDERRKVNVNFERIRSQILNGDEKEFTYMLRFGFYWTNTTAGVITNPYFNSNNFALPNFREMTLKHLRVNATTLNSGTGIYTSFNHTVFISANGLEEEVVIPGWGAPSPGGTYSNSYGGGLGVFHFPSSVVEQSMYVKLNPVNGGNIGIQGTGNPSFGINDVLYYQLDMTFAVKR